IHIYPSFSTGIDDPIDLSPKGTGYSTIVRNNIIIKTHKRTKDPGGTGYALINYLPETHTFVLENNCLHKNSAGNYKNCTSTTDIYVDPLFANQKIHDYHLKSTGGRWNGKTWVKDFMSSPCIDAGCPYSNYSNEPEPNGNRTNIGRFGNTEYASNSGVMPGYVMWWDQAFSSEWRVFRLLLRLFFRFCFNTLNTIY
ncbi:MAG: hypothetical protein EHM20_03365, partial [Alphaproteobacteria bacterium]